MKKNKILLLSLCCAVGLSSCHSYNFNQEQYKKQLNLLSNSEEIFDTQTIDLSKESDTLMLVTGISGSLASTQSYAFKVLPADTLFNAYNKSNFDIKKDRYARMLSDHYFEMPSDEGAVAPGAPSAYLPIVFKNLSELSPDSVYFVEYKFDEESMPAELINQKKKNVLVRVHWKNKYADTRSNNSYTNYQAYVLNLSDNTLRRPTNTVRCFPLSGNAVRFLAGDEGYGDYKYAHKQILEKSIMVTVGQQTPRDPDAYSVTISPYQPFHQQMTYTKTVDGVDQYEPLDYTPLQVSMLLPFNKYDNTYRITVVKTPDGLATYYREFRLHYKYKLGNSQDWKEVKTILRQQYIPSAELY